MRTSTRRFHLTSLVALGITFGAVSEGAKAATVTLDALTSGKYWNSGTVSGNQGITALDGFYRSFLGFDLSSIGANILGATLEIGSHANNPSGQTINLWEVSTPYSNLGTSGASIYADLADGASYGTGTHTGGIINSYTLTGAALSSLNAAASDWAVGIQAIGNAYAFSYTWGVTEGDHLKLVLTTANQVPDGGSTLGMMALSLLAFVGVKRMASPVTVKAE